MEWDLTDLYKSLNDPQIEKDKKEIEKLSQEFIKKYKGKINSKHITEKFLLKAFIDIEKIETKLSLYGSYAYYVYCLNTADTKSTKFYQESNEFGNYIASLLLWFDLELKDTNKTTKTYEHYLTHLRSFKKFTLSEKEEILMTKKSQTGISALVRLYDETSSSETYDLEIDGKKMKLSYSEINPYLTKHPNRNIRKKATEAISKKLRENEKIYTFILNTKLLDKKINDEIRGFKYPEEATLLGYEINKNTLEAMSSVIQKSYHLTERFYKAKQKLLKLDNLYEWDRYSSIYPDLTEKYSWEDAKETVLGAFGNFDKNFQKIALDFFDKNWIDSKLRTGKMSGAYCSYNAPSHHPYILMNFTGKTRDVSTLAHELGHGIHFVLCKNQNLFNYHPSTATAEIASIFAENIVFEKVFNETKDKKTKINLLGDYIQDIFATVMRQNAFNLFEQDIHNKRRIEGELETTDFNKLYQKRLQDSFGKGLTLSKNHEVMWMPILHFYHFNFYVFTYCFGQLLTLTLFAKYKKDGKAFTEKYLHALSLGGSLSPTEITKTLGVDINDPEFWNTGLKLVDDYVTEFVNLTK